MQLWGFCFLPFVLFTFFDSTLQVSVSLYDGATHPQNSITCLNLLPGQCCLPPNGQRNLLRNAQMVTFDHLATNDIAAIWSRRGHVSRSSGYIGECSGVVLASRSGPGLWTWRGRRDPGTEASIPRVGDAWATGASYIELPVALPPHSSTANWVAAEGILGLVWGGGSWFAGPAAARLLGGPGGAIPNSQLRRSIRSANKGTVYAASPRRAVYPTSMVVNGTNFTHGGEGDSRYRSKAGQVLDLMED